MRVILASIFILYAGIHGASASDNLQNPVNPDVFTICLVIAVAVGLFIGLSAIKSGVANSQWSLADALSEEADITLQADGKPIVGQDGKALIGSELRASSSRLIALLGLVAILVIYIGFGLVVVRDFSEGQLPDKGEFDRLNLFMFSGVTMFAPYIVNKFSSVFDWLKPVPKS